MRFVTSTLFLMMLACESSDSGGAATAELEPAGPGAHVPIRRLTRDEYNYTVRDLLGTELQPATDLPADDSTDGFDSVGDGLVMSPLHVELFETAAAALAAEAVVVPLEAPIEEFASTEDLISTIGGPLPGQDGWIVWSNGTVDWQVYIPADGTYVFGVDVYGSHAGPDLPAWRVLIDDLEVLTGEASATSAETAERIEVEAELGRGIHTFSVQYTNDFTIPATDDEPAQDRNLFIKDLMVRGPDPFYAQTNPIRDGLMTCEPDPADPEPCLTEVLSAFASRAWRRPIEDSDIDDLISPVRAVLDAGDPWTWGLEFALRRILTHPEFLFLNTFPAAGETLERLPDHALAERLSYFLWSSMPDETLKGLADSGTLQRDDVLKEEILRMLRDPKAAALTERLAGQWLLIRAVDDISPDPWAFPEFDERLREGMKGEMSRLFQRFIGSDLPMTELLTSQWGYVDWRLADHYGVDRPSSLSGMSAYNASSVGRGGWLGQAGLQAALAYPTRTSPTLRGAWVLGALLCEEPNPPPPGVEGIEAQDDIEGLTVREQFEMHASDPVCAACHLQMDPIGFSFEHFDAIGAWRDTEETASGSTPIDASGELPDGRSFNGVQELSALVVDDPRFPRCMVDRTLTYALGRTLGDHDELAIDRMTDQFIADGLTFDALATAIVTSEVFRSRGLVDVGGAE
ncbi:MAG: DUF1592 domain-containing protein [Myxococcota bacterium]